MKDKEEKNSGVMRLQVPKPLYAISCLICGKTVRTYDYPVIDVAVCDDCKKAIEYIKEKIENER